VILPLVRQLRELHAWHAEHPQIDLSTFDRNLGACNGRGRFCGAGERDACDFSAIGTPIIQLRTKGPRPVTNPLDRLAALKARASGAPAPAATPKAELTPAPADTHPASAVEVPATAGVVDSEATPASASTTTDPAPARKRGRPARIAPPSAAPEGPNGPANINPPESKEALAAMQAAAQEELATIAPSEAIIGAVLALREMLPAGISVTITGIAAVTR
jgi:hypothetical protein